MPVAGIPCGGWLDGVDDPAGSIWWAAERLSAEPYF